MEMKDRVIFRRWKKDNTVNRLGRPKRNGGGVIAILPDQDANPGHYMMYEHVGQHGEGVRGVIDVTTPCVLNHAGLPFEDDARALYDELQSIGYELTVVRRLRKKAERRAA